MRQKRLMWLAGVAAVAAFVAAAPALASQKAEPVPIGSFSGAYLAGRVAEVDSDLPSAIAYYTRALSFDPDNLGLQQSLMLALVAEGRFDEALPYAQKLKSEPDVERFSRLALAIEALRKGNYTGAEDWLTLAFESDLDRLVSRTMTAWAKVGEGDKAGALAIMNDLQGPEWYDLFVSYHKALIAEDTGDDAAASAAFEETVANINAGSAAPEAWLRAAEAYAGLLLRQGEKDKAVEVLDKADEFAPGRPAIAALRELAEKDKRPQPLVKGAANGASELLLNLATALNRGGGEPYVQLYLRFAQALKPDSDVVLVQLAGVAEQRDDAEQAIELYRRIPDNSPLKRSSELQLGLNLADLGRQEEAVAHLRRLLDADPDDMRAYVALGGVYASKENYKEAAAVYDRAVERIPNPDRTDWNVFYQRGIAYERLKQWPKAEPNFRKALELYPDQPQVLNYLGYSWVDMNTNLEEGLDMIRKAVDLRPSDGYIVDSLGWAYYRLGRYDEAVTELERAVSLKPDDPVLNDHLGDAYWRAGRKLEATFQWSHARDMKPEPDLLASVQKKLAEGLPAVDEKAASQPSVDEPAPAADEEPMKKTELETPAELMAVTPARYTVLPGQSLWSIANDQLGNGKRYIEILKLNPGLRGDPSRLFPGMELTLPGPAQ
ncbi:MAG: tetratricopeptide repeat protein [Rhizobiaceae bacterium]|nr:tetratricopeptide repeat protein [Rhizobiaceae bacterium]